MVSRAGVLLLLALSCQGVRAAAQGAQNVIGVDATIGRTAGKGGDYLDRELQYLRVGVNGRRVWPSHYGVFGEAGYDLLWHGGDRVTICRLTTDGGCVPWYPGISGPTGVVGIVAQPASALELRLGVGGAVYEISRSNEPKSTRVGAVVTSFDLTAMASSHVGLTTGVHWNVVPRYRGDRLLVVSPLIGLRIQ